MTDRCEPPPELRGVEWFDNAHIMGMWDSWRRYIAEGGGASWPRDAFECLLDAHDAEVEALQHEIHDLRHDLNDAKDVERENTTLRARVAELEKVVALYQAEVGAFTGRGTTLARLMEIDGLARAALSAETP